MKRQKPDITFLKDKNDLFELLRQAVKGLEEEIADEEAMSEPIDSPYAASIPPPVMASSLFSKKVFLVHGRDDAAKNEVAFFLRAIGLEPIILHLRANGGRHLLTKSREESEGAGFAVVLMMTRAVLLVARRFAPEHCRTTVFELGFFIGKLGPDHVAALLNSDVETPSDFERIAFISFDSGRRWKTELARELHHAKVPFDPAKALLA
jgi:predicted nucleotide-binding protein